MALKILDFSFVDRDGFTKHYACTIISNVEFNYEKAFVELTYKAWKDADAREAKALPKIIRQRFAINLGDTDILSKILSISDTIWELNMGLPFIDDYQEVGGKLIPVSKSITQLDGIVTDA